MTYVVRPPYLMVDGRESPGQLPVARQTYLRHDGHESWQLECSFSEKPYFRWWIS